MKTVPALMHFPPGLLPLMASYLGPDSLIIAGGIGGNDGLPRSSADCYSFTTKSWCTKAWMSTARIAAAAVVIGDRMLVFGGHNGSDEKLDTCEAFDPVADAWCPLPPMLVVRHPISAVEWGGRAFVFGRVRGSTIFSGECFDPVLGTWSPIAPMTTTHYNIAVVAVPSRGIFVMDGAADDQVVQIFHPDRNVWSSMKWKLPFPASIHTLFCIDTILYFVGANPGDRRARCHSMDLVQSPPTWKRLSSLALPFPIRGMTSVLVDVPSHAL